MPDTHFRDAFNTLERYIERRWGIPVVITDVPNPFTGDLETNEEMTNDKKVPRVVARS